VEDEPALLKRYREFVKSLGTVKVIVDDGYAVNVCGKPSIGIDMTETPGPETVTDCEER
jgi:adenine deaminase